ncbi:MAG: DNA-binding protein [Gammaproteobacteria bacterium]|jgi:nucleoid DNA-binding protein|nr:MAG: DNA-binding protein [Gammaproteobacteria bacterium]
MAKKPSPIADKQTKSQILSTLAEDTGLAKKEVAAVVDALAVLASRHLKKNGSGEFTVPSLGIKLRRVIKPARKARKGINPFTGEEIMIKAKPASTSVRAIALKALKDSVA